MFIASEIASPPVLPPAPSAQAPAAPQDAQGNQDANTSSAGGSGTSQVSQNQQDGSQGQARQGAGATPLPGESRFSQILNARQSNGGHAQAADAVKNTSSGNAQNGQANQNAGDASESSASGSAASAVIPGAAGNVVALIVSTQLQAIAGDASAQQAADNAVPAASTAPVSAADLLRQLQQWVAQLENTDSGASSAPDNAPDNAQNTGTQSSPDKSAKDAASLPQLLAQLASMLQGLMAQAAPQRTAELAVGAAQDTNALDAGASASGGNASPLARLAELVQSLERQLGASTGMDNAGGKAADATNAASAAPASFDATLNALLQQTDTKAALQSILSDITQAIAPVKDAKSDANTSGDSGANTPVPQSQGVSAAAPAQPAAPDSGFVKLLPAASTTPPAADQVLVQIKNAADSAANQIKIQLAPADLGKVVVQMTTGADGKTGITITADNRQTLAMLQNEARSLESALRDIGMKTGGGGLNFNLSGQQHNSGNTGKQGGYTQVAAAGEEDADYQGAVTQLYRYTAQDGLDIRV